MSGDDGTLNVRTNEITQKLSQNDQENQNNKKIKTLDLATFDQIPEQLAHILKNDVCKCQNYTQFDVLNAIVLYCAYESSLIGDWQNDINLSNYTLNWCSAFNSRILQHCTFPNNYHRINSSPLKLTFKFILEQSRKVVLYSLDSGDFAILSTYEVKDLDKIHSTRTYSVAIPMSRYIPFRKLCDNVENSFRHLKELSIVLKEKLFIPIRNQIYEDCAVGPSPCLNGMPECVLIKIFRYLNKNDINSLKCTCRKQFELCKAFASNKKRKFE